MRIPVIGVVGGGQLARMMAPAAVALGIELRVLAENADVCAVSAVPTASVGDYHDLSALRAFAADVDVLTFDHEHVPTEHLRALLASGVNVQPGPAALIHAQDKLIMRAAVDRLGLPNPMWAAVSSIEELVKFGTDTGWPVVLKTPRGGYDGKGVRVIEDAAAAAAAANWFSVATDDDGAANQGANNNGAARNQPAGRELLVESKVPFSRELAALVARSPDGNAKAWPVVHTIQVDGVCDEVIAPAQDLPVEVAAAAQRAALRLAEELDVTGVLAVELFETPGSGTGFLINELAMRPHNSGHWTIDGSVTSQFEQHLRAVLNLPLGDTAVVGQAAVMKNILGGSNDDLYSAYPATMQHWPSAKVHNYGKTVRPGRKIGHVTMVAEQDSDLARVRHDATCAAATLADGPSTMEEATI